MESIPEHKIIRSQLFSDCFFLSIVVLISLILYIPSLGFYSDDWSFLAPLNLSTDQSFLGLFQSVYLHQPNVQMRPVQVLYIAGLYWLFGLNPLGYHLINCVFLSLGIVFFYLVLRELKQPRFLALSIPLVYALLPHYSTNRFWVAAFQITLSMTLYFLSLYADLVAVRTKTTLGLWAWKLISIASLLISGLAYEIFLPWFLFNPLLSWYKGRLLNQSILSYFSKLKLILLMGSTFPCVVFVFLFKKMTTTRQGELEFKEHLGWLFQLFKDAVTISYGDYGFKLPRIVGSIIYSQTNWVILILGGLVGLVVFSYLFHIVKLQNINLLNYTNGLKLTLASFFVFAAGYSIFLLTQNAQNSAAGISNRIAIASAIGVAFTFIGLIGLASSFIRTNRSRKVLFCLLIALLCSSGFIINNAIASYWADAYRQEQNILADIQQHLPSLKDDATLILDGICPYSGPAVVFESNWDLAGALRIIYKTYTLKADVVTPNLQVNEDGLTTALYYGSLVSHYPYENLLIYNIKDKLVHEITDADAAYRYFQTFNADYDNNCPKGREGHGVRIF
ncbi:hypothetical protein H6F93_18005 [Leptolyngbya sp. FACHB-671]|uniref:hypothetical protein n=1 Tax=Leptolyngbya sp. FACHB-671 TaxID=2692812 RepID=UPI001685CD3B|nr:hypothetical protein [Leptolyngbya sp. FACHB-671]MBD2069391.1 hypothetical protein [Leptolyngbya sp. FACHB-671]